MILNKSQELPLSIRALIVGYYLQIKLGWMEISMKLGISNDTARMFYKRVLEESGGVEDLYEMLEHLESKLRPGAPPIIEPGEQSTQVRELVRKRPTFQRAEAANFEGPIGSAPLKETNVRRILFEPKYCLADPIDQRRIKPHKRVRKTALILLTRKGASTT